MNKTVINLTMKKTIYGFDTQEWTPSRQQNGNRAARAPNWQRSKTANVNGTVHYQGQMFLVQNAVDDLFHHFPVPSFSFWALLYHLYLRFAVYIYISKFLVLSYASIPRLQEFPCVSVQGLWEFMALSTNGVPSGERT